MEHTDLVYPIVDLLQDFSAGTRPSFSVLTDEDYTAELLTDSYNMTQMLPPQFLISLSYSPQNNTALRLLSVYTGSDSEQHNTNTSIVNGFQDNSSSTTAANTSTPSASLMLTSTVTYLQSDGYLDLWSNLSLSSYHALTLMVHGGQLRSCLDGEFLPEAPPVNLWSTNSSQDSIQLAFSPHLHAVASVVSPLSV